MIRRISTKWLLAVLAVVVLPFLGFAWFVDAFVSQRFSEDVVRYHLLGHAAELSERLDSIVAESRKNAQILAAVQDVSYCLAGYNDDSMIFGRPAEQLFDELVSEIGSAEFVLAIDNDGHVVASNTLRVGGAELDKWTSSALRSYPWAEKTWFQNALENGSASIDVTRFGFVHEDTDVPPEARYHFGFAHRVLGKRSTFSEVVPVGMVVTLVPWSVVQNEISTYGVTRRRKEELGNLQSENLYATSYAWVWGDDARTILAHKDRSLYGMHVDEPPVNLPAMVEAASTHKWGMYPEYDFNGEHKKAAFRHGRSRKEGGFGWVVGVGVDTREVYGPIRSMTRTIAQASALVLLLAVVVTFVVARRTTRPIQDLEAFTRRVASGDLDAQVPVHGHDELADLTRSFNRMTLRLKDNSDQLVKAEKDAAWREMARQVAHEIKNPLTPIQLWASLLKRAHDDKSPEFEGILEKSIDVIQRQVRTMRDIARDFYRFAGEHRDPVEVELRTIVAEVVEINDAWAQEEGVELIGERPLESGIREPAIVMADPDELRRALVNLVSNAMEAIDGVEPPPGKSAHRIEVRVDRDGDFIEVEIRDTGKGISDEAATALFEPYFTTRSSGTGLGLAIVRRIVEDRGGSITLENRADTRGAIATLRLPVHKRSSSRAVS
ncbi:Sensor protein ZraS [Planctomycetes bacterium Poly30]|uniref:histidine kinase n=1 Tax=Saltatorellus ferox TaxID=2528018 RepID=A0A518EQ65_9BACT|nr:Sensor protein ZraS [Planctomycetes bacterium Poly30]